ncbi:DUF5050 domain-containing protein [Bacillus sp. RAR_GA_16]|uniref:DUF5050 domain-containing protein n=1 Tax=Bacillus sp. RAR_GA_16 TaxID=2876774 RepID=UPI001CCB1969|nr:DUF5050 domain-containing protein [Bacillus sp. RAR_GA_16]MCA0173962.1 DUF5050 domain-containing protein [Bacillus sp. RAR_GA_16]
MKQKNYLYASLVCFVLLAGAITYNILHNEDAYLGYTGLGDSIELTDDDSQVYFSYYQDGEESIYRANSNGDAVKQITQPDDERHRKPVLSPDGKNLLYLSENEDRIQSLYIADLNGEHQKKLTDDTVHVAEAVFSDDQIYYVGMPAEAVGKAEGETKEGFDLHSVGLDGENDQKLTDEDHFTMNHLASSDDGSAIYYTLFNGNDDKIYAYNVENGKETRADWVPSEVGAVYDWNYDEAKSAFAFTNVSDESENSSLFKYELYYRDLNEGETKQLTTLESSVVSPEFFHQSNKIAFLEYTNWANHPEEYVLKTVDVASKEVKEVSMDLPGSTNSQWVRKTLNVVTSSIAIAVYYTVLLSLLTIYYYKKSGKRYRTGLVSILLAVAVFLSSILVAMLSDPWAGIALGILAVGMLPSSVIALLVGLIIGRLEKTTQEEAVSRR